MLSQISLFISFYIGCIGFLYILKDKSSWIEKLGLSFPIASVIWSLVWWLLNWLFATPINATLGYITMCVSIFLGLGAILLIRKDNKYIRKFTPGLSLSSMATSILIALLAAMMLTNIVYNINTPITDWDSLTLYDFRALRAAENQSLEIEPLQNSYILGYPLYTSIGHLYGYVFDSHSPKLFYSLLYLSGILIFYSLLLKVTSNLISTLGATTLGLYPLIVQHSYMAYTNLAHSFFVGFAFLYLFEWWRSGSNRNLFLSSFFIMASSWTRSVEPFFMVYLGILLIMIVQKHRRVRFLISILPVLILRQLWEYYRTIRLESGSANVALEVAGLTNSTLDLMKTIANPEHLSIVWNFFIENAILPHKSLLLAIFFATLHFIIVRSRSGYMLMLINGSLALFIFLGTLQFSLVYQNWINIPGSLTKVSMTMIPVLIYYVFYSFRSNS